MLYSEPSGDKGAIALIMSPSSYLQGHEKYRGPILFNPGWFAAHAWIGKEGLTLIVTHRRTRGFWGRSHASGRTCISNDPIRRVRPSFIRSKRSVVSNHLSFKIVDGILNRIDKVLVLQPLHRRFSRIKLRPESSTRKSR